MNPLSYTKTRGRSTLLAATAVLAVSVLGGLVAAPANAVPPDADVPPDRPVAHLSLSATPMDPSDPETPIGDTRTVTLICRPDGDRGTHPSPPAACDSLRAVDGRFQDLPWDPEVACTDEYQPVEVRATGLWADDKAERLVLYEETFGNGCNALIGTDYVFNF